jgi:peptide deformylase
MQTTTKTDRRRFLWLSSAAGLWTLSGCARRACPPADQRSAPDRHFQWSTAEQGLVAAERDDFDIVVRGGPGGQVLRTRARPVPASIDLIAVEQRMIETMNRASGVGIAAPQVGLSLRVALLKLDYKTDNPYTVFVRNPVIVERSDETVDGYEGCLSIPGVGGLVRRNRWIRVEHALADGQVVTTEAEDANAVLWQHELDHLDGVLYVDLLLGELLPMDEVRRLREKLDRGEQTRRFGDCLEGSTLIVARATRPHGLRRIAELLLG